MTDKIPSSAMRRFILKSLVGVAKVAPVAIAASHVRINLENPDLTIESYKVGDLTIFPIAFDHIPERSNLNQAVEQFQTIKDQKPDLVPLIEYFPPEIQIESKLATDSIEYGDIEKQYGGFIDSTGTNHVLVADPAYNIKFMIPKFLPLAVGGSSIKIGFDDMLKEMFDPTLNKIKELSEIDKKRLLLDLFSMGMGASTVTNTVFEGSTGRAGTLENPTRFPYVIDETDFRHLTIAVAIKQISRMAETIGTKNVALIFPKYHLDGIMKILNEGEAEWIRNKIEYKYYDLMYSWLNFMDIREYQRNFGEGENWIKVLDVPIKVDNI